MKNLDGTKFLVIFGILLLGTRSWWIEPLVQHSAQLVNAGMMLFGLGILNSGLRSSLGKSVVVMTVITGLGTAVLGAWALLFDQPSLAILSNTVICVAGSTGKLDLKF